MTFTKMPHDTNTLAAQTYTLMTLVPPENKTTPQKQKDHEGEFRATTCAQSTPDQNLNKPHGHVHARFLKLCFGIIAKAE